MKCETKAKRRVTLSICGLGMLDETEVETSTGVLVSGESEPQQIEPPRRKSDSPAPDGALITESQRKKFFATFKEAGHAESDVKRWLGTAHGIEHSKDIPQALLDAILTRLADTTPLFADGPTAE